MTDIAAIVKQLLRVGYLIVIDIVAFVLCLFISWLVRSDILPLFINSLPPFLFSFSYFLTLWWVPLIFIFFIFYEDLYEKHLPFWDETLNMIKAVSLSAVVILAIVTLGKMGDRVSRIVLLFLWMSALGIFPLFRLWGTKLLYKTWRERVLILGAGNAGRLVMEGIVRERHLPYEVVGFLDDDEDKKGLLIHGKKIFGKVKHFPRIVKDLRISTVIIAMPSLSPGQLAALTAHVQNFSINTMIIPDLKRIALLNTELLHLFYEEIFLMNIRNNLKSLPNRLVKQTFDLIVSLILMPLLLPLIGIIGIIIRLETPGHAIYAHDRIGEKGKPFRCYKFRTMQKDAEEKLNELLEESEEIRSEWEKHWKLKDDPRITKVGRFLRKTSLDELPQIFNVLRGSMSLVGPRPYLLRERDEIIDDLPLLCSTKPGITGLWQVSGRSTTGHKHRVRLDTWYVMNWSLWLDIVILFKTVRVVTKMEGAY